MVKIRKNQKGCSPSEWISQGLKLSLKNWPILVVGQVIVMVMLMNKMDLSTPSTTNIPPEGHRQAVAAGVVVGTGAAAAGAAAVGGGGNVNVNVNVNDLSKPYDVCIVGAGLSGSVLAERYSSQLQKSVLVMDKRSHIGGNCYDYIDEDTGIRVSQYGAHLFHTKYPTVWSYVQKFGPWTPYEHKVRGLVNGKNVPIPVNIETVNTLFDLNIKDSNEMDEWLKKEQIPFESPKNSEEVALSRVGQRLYDLIFKPYTFKQWAKYPAELGPEVLSRIPVRNNNDERYFSDPHQALPTNGYTSLFDNMLSSPLITVKTNTDFFQVRDQLKCGRLYFSGPIDAYFAHLGWPKLEYRSLDFERRVERNVDYYQSNFVVNRPQDEVDYTRVVEYKHLPNQNSPHTIYFIERSKDGGEPYYPVPNEKNQELFRRYKEMAEKEKDVSFVGRLANYKYFNMDEAIKNALDLFEKDTGLAYKEGGTPPQAAATPSKGSIPEGLVSHAGEFNDYENVPPVEFTPELEARVQKALELPIGEPYGLRHKANPPGHDAIMGLAAYPTNMGTFRLVVGSLRNAGYDGHIIFGVHAKIPPKEEEYLKKMDVTYYIVDFVDCDDSIKKKEKGGGVIRGKCSKGIENLTLEWGRFEMCRQWLNACKECTGWNLVMDTRDIFFQSHPFASLPDPSQAQQDLLFIEEIAPHTNPLPNLPKRADIIGESRYVGRTVPCYGRDHYKAYYDRPVLCSGTIVGTRKGMLRFLSVLVDEFHSNNAKENEMCHSPHATDQWTMDYLYYNGRFGEPHRTKTLPYGTGPINTIGTPCIDRYEKDNSKKHSNKDMLVLDDKTGLIVNIHEPEGSKARIAPAVHQYDRCAHWIGPFLKEHPEVTGKRNGKDIPTPELPPLPWQTGRL